jgi:hypothetical protein
VILSIVQPNLPGCIDHRTKILCTVTLQGGYPVHRIVYCAFTETCARVRRT